MSVPFLIAAALEESHPITTAGGKKKCEKIKMYICILG